MTGTQGLYSERLVGDDLTKSDRLSLAARALRVSPCALLEHGTGPSSLERGCYARAPGPTSVATLARDGAGDLLAAVAGGHRQSVLASVGSGVKAL